MKAVERAFKEKSWICSLCGYVDSERFRNDICPKCKHTYWQCFECGFTIDKESPPVVCPECDQEICFINITCYIPDWDEVETIG